MNRITIEPSPLPHQWAHIWIKGFTVVRTEYHPTLYLTESDVQWLRGTYVLVTPTTCAAVEVPARTTWYTEQEKKDFAAERKAKREATDTQEEFDAEAYGNGDQYNIVQEENL